MKRDNIWDGFVKLFPEYEKKVEAYAKIGSKSLKLKMLTEEGEPERYLIFLYNDPWDWTLGTKVWRAKPRKQYHRSNIDRVIETAAENESAQPTLVEGA